VERFSLPARKAIVEGLSMKADELLLWLSARRQGSWEQFKGAVESLHLADDPLDEGQMADTEDDRSGLPLYQELRLNLSALAHVEFFATGCENGWRVSPPVLAARRHEHRWTALLCGARSRPLLDRLSQAAAGKAVIETEQNDAAPLLYRICAPDVSMLEGIATAAGVSFQREAALAILRNIPPVSDRQFLKPAPLRIGAEWQVNEFSTESLRWVSSNREQAAGAQQGLFQFWHSYERRYFLRLDGETYEVSGQAGKYMLLRQRRRPVLHYSAQSQTLSVPASCRPPPLIERALVLCTGVLPSFDPKSKSLAYRSVPLAAVRLASRLLCQEIKR
jgi:hypothetical protein